ncbi:serine/threonine-protein kinase [Nonomuraea sp. NPDC050310]|uniref:serine/threonine-protein kinase n=1 Tax=Nonomuraea sp. NPDC050310 TaxID=3154935 RepID=UPI0033FCE459
MVFPLEPDDPQQLGPYRLAGRLGEGGQGVVYLGFDASGERVAVKMLSRGDRETRARLGRELQALESIASFCTARVLDASVDGPTPWVVSEFVDGPSLAQRLHERGPLRGGELERLAIGTATALAAIHSAGVVHRDFKPGNVLLGPDGPRVVDFGIARAEGAATMTSGLIGTPAYLAPEQISGSPASPASDVFAWAATVVCAATGHSPFGADTVPAVMHRVLYAEPDLSALPVRLRGIIGAALSKDPGRRPSARDLMVTLVNPNATAVPVAENGGAGATAGGGSAGSGPGSGLGPDSGPAYGSGSGPGFRPDYGPGSGPGYGPGSGPGFGYGGQPGGGSGPHVTGPGHPAVTTHPPAGGRPRSRRGLTVGLVAGALALAVTGGALWLTLGPGLGDGGTVKPTVTAGQSAAAARKSAAPAEESPAPDGTPTPDDESPESGKALRIPQAFAGTWKGATDGTAIDGKEFNDEPVTVILAAGKERGSWISPGDGESDPGCGKGDLELTHIEGEVLTFRLTGMGGVCASYEMLGVHPTITLTRTGDRTMGYAFTTIAGSGNGHLRKQ